jgi:hypothetical protein
VGENFDVKLDIEAICSDAKAELDTPPDLAGFMECLDIVEALLDVYTVH